MVDELAGFKEREHTADWALEVWAPDLTALLKQAATGMYALAGMRLQSAPRQSCQFELQALDAESLLVRFLSELLYLQEEAGLGFDRFDLQWDGHHLTARVEGAPVASQDKEIKAVTYHDLLVRQTSLGLDVCIVFDV